MKLVTMFFGLVLALSVHAIDVGRITKLKGEVSILPPTSHQAHPAVIGEILQKDSSILTKEKSFVLIDLFNKSKLNLGPNSKIFLNQVGDAKDDTKIISLMKGYIRSSVEKMDNSPTKERVLLKTPSAAMAVRGTKFQLSYNQQNEMTSLVTVEGKVAMAKIEKKEFMNLAVHPELSSEVVKKAPVVMVDDARYAGSGPNLEIPTKPVTIAPEQYIQLRTLDDFNDEKKLTAEDAKVELIKIVDSRQESPDADYDDKKHQVKPKSGGYIDIETSFYVPPTQEAKVDEQFKVYVEKDASKKVVSADYVPPKGIELDAVKGFVKQDQQAKIEIAPLNEMINVQLPKKKLKPTEDDLNLEQSDVYKKYFR